ncbi:MAG: hypothetical protein HETSPECPRED_002017 [Heterodermia speciosa]|uniref:Aromatic amino acid beta-eliminating lyase/threonine aldolase domain-containing protein n=1 Tax=Heterodermia speciosa TaxID=116794 RepID=A0A8H3IG56_9LECA|nr:MAG: hypothetical protein HETSPECPRED_002017 [Heterodermia speciosa]
MTKYSFYDDYSEGAHIDILRPLPRAARDQQKAYGDDEFSEEARKAIRSLIGADEARIYFTPSGTGANLLSVASHLRPHEAVIAAESGHIVGEEGGAIEATGHQILTEPPGVDGKLTPGMIYFAFDRSWQSDFQPKPKMVFIANATESGTVYTKSELKAIADICLSLKLFLLLDGARLGVALTSSHNDLSLKDIYDLTDIFWIGGTTNGAMFGEAVVIKHPSFGVDFPYHMNQQGALLAKGRFLGIQFRALFQDDLFFRIARDANSAAAELSSSLVKMGLELWVRTESNRVFPIVPPALAEELQKHFDFCVWKHLSDESLVIRLVTSWQTRQYEVQRFCKIVQKWTKKSSCEL